MQDKFETAFETHDRNKKKESERKMVLQKKVEKTFDFSGKSSFKGFKYRSPKPFNYSQVTQQKKRLGLK